MTSKTIPPEDAMVDTVIRWLEGRAKWADAPAQHLEDTSLGAGLRNAASVMRELQSLRSTQPDREAIIEEIIALVAEENNSKRGRTGTRSLWYPGELIDFLRSLKHSDTTPDGGKNG